MNLDIGIIAFPFGHSAGGPNRSNRALASEVAAARYRVKACGSSAVMVSESEITEALRQTWDMRVAHSVERRANGTHLSNRAIWEEAKKVFKREDITEVIVIAQPLLVRPVLQLMVAADGYQQFGYKMWPIPLFNFS